MDLSKLTENLDEQLAVFRQRYPELSRLLLDVREEHMAAKLRDLIYFTSGQVVAVIGYGHMRSLAKSLSSLSTKPVYSANITWSSSTSS